MTNVWVVSWEYSDKSGNGIVGIFDTERTASILCRALTIQSIGGRNFSIKKFVVNELAETNGD
jgi:hypothetical protein